MRETLASRSLLTLGFLATRPKAAPELAQRLEKLLDDAVSGKKERGDPRLEKYRLLVALDRGDDLEKIAFRSRFSSGDDPAPLCAGAEGGLYTPPRS